VRANPEWSAQRTLPSCWPLLPRGSDMIRKTLTLLAACGLVLSLALWGISRYGLCGWRADGLRIVTIHQGRIAYGKRPAAPLPGSLWTPALPGVSSFWASPSSGPGLVAAKDQDEWRWAWGWSDSASPTEPEWVPLVNIASRGLGTWSTWKFPLRLPIILFAASIAAIHLPRILRRGRRARLGLCQRCGYDLRGCSDARCSECNNGFDPERVRRQRQRCGIAAARAGRWFAAYNASPRRPRLATISLLGMLFGGMFWFASSLGITYKSSKLTCRMSRGNLIVYTRPSPDVTAKTGWSINGAPTFSTVWWLRPFFSGETLYIPVCTGTVLCAALWTWAYRPLYRLCWQGAVAEDTPADDHDEAA